MVQRLTVYRNCITTSWCPLCIQTIRYSDDASQRSLVDRANLGATQMDRFPALWTTNVLSLVTHIKNHALDSWVEPLTPKVVGAANIASGSCKVTEGLEGFAWDVPKKNSSPEAARSKQVSARHYRERWTTGVSPSALTSSSPQGSAASSPSVDDNDNTKPVASKTASETTATATEETVPEGNEKRGSSCIIC